MYNQTNGLLQSVTDANGVTTTYYYVGGRLYGESVGYSTRVYLYDDTDSPYGYIYNDTSYYYEKNAQGDVIGLWHQNGVKIANYTYDAWGNILSITNQYGEDVTSRPRHQGNLNPIRYRGYYYDVELEMYWLSTRFYDPEIGRFVNADAQLNDGMLGNNLYAYCVNNPVNYQDITGQAAIVICGIALSASAVATIAVCIFALATYVLNIGGFRTAVNNVISWAITGVG